MSVSGTADAALQRKRVAVGATTDVAVRSAGAETPAPYHHTSHGSKRGRGLDSGRGAASAAIAFVLVLLIARGGPVTATRALFALFLEPRGF